jgi:DNA-binding NarL/FixJ family response regulator
MSHRFLVVDDTSFMRKMAADCLQQFGYVVVGEAINGREAIMKYEELQPDIVMMDLNMPEMNGIDAIKEILKINPLAVVLVCSASHQRELIYDALEAGAKGYLTKPFNPDRMNEIIQKYAEPHLPAQHPEPTSLDLTDINAIAELAVAHQETVEADYDELDTEQTKQTDEPDEPESQPIHRLKSEQEVNIVKAMRRASFVTSYMCNWQEEIHSGTTNYSVICTEKENKILIESTGDSQDKQAIEFTLEGFRQLISWLEAHLDSSTLEQRENLQSNQLG